MILKASQRGGAGQLAAHLLRTDENEHVDVHELRGFVASDLKGALTEAYAVSKGTRCTQFLFSISLSPPQTEDVPVAVFEAAIQDIEEAMGLTGQPRAIVFHEKKGRRHAHCVWSRIDAEQMKAINLAHFKLKLRDISRQLYIEHGWQMPAGLVNSAEKDPRYFTQAEWQQAKRADIDPRAIKEALQDSWAISDSMKAFIHALASRGLYLAKGDRRNFVVVDLKGQVYALARWLGLRTKAVNVKLGPPDSLPSVDETEERIVTLKRDVLDRHIAQIDAKASEALKPLEERRQTLVAHHRTARNSLKGKQVERIAEEAIRRSQRYRRGVLGLWDRLTGRYARTCRENNTDLKRCHARDAGERQMLINGQLMERLILQEEMRYVRATQAADLSAVLKERGQLTPSLLDPDQPKIVALKHVHHGAARPLAQLPLLGLSTLLLT